MSKTPVAQRFLDERIGRLNQNHRLHTLHGLYKQEVI